MHQQGVDGVLPEVDSDHGKNVKQQAQHQDHRNGKPMDEKSRQRYSQTWGPLPVLAMILNIQFNQ